MARLNEGIEFYKWFTYNFKFMDLGLFARITNDLNIEPKNGRWITLEDAYEIFLKEYKEQSGFINSQIIKDAIQLFGDTSQMRMVREECLELAVAIGKCERNKYDPKTVEGLIDEIADVEIMMAQVRYLVPSPLIDQRIDFKMKRLEQLIIDEKEKLKLK